VNWIKIQYKKKVLRYVITEVVRSSNADKPYDANFPDNFGNVCVRQRKYPEASSKYFKSSNQAYIHNQSRKFDVALAKIGSY